MRRYMLDYLAITTIVRKTGVLVNGIAWQFAIYAVSSLRESPQHESSRKICLHKSVSKIRSCGGRFFISYV